MPFNEVGIMPGKPDISNGYLLILLRATQITPPILPDTKYFIQTSVTGLTILHYNCLNIYSFTRL